jgi:hypothetical protein
MEEIDKETRIVTIIGYSLITVFTAIVFWFCFTMSYGKLIKRYSWTDTVSYVEEYRYKGYKRYKIYNRSGEYIGSDRFVDCSVPKKGDTILFINKRYPYREEQQVFVNDCWLTGSSALWPIHKLSN